MRREPRSEHRTIRCNVTESEVWGSLAEADDRTFSDWARRTLNAAAGLDERPLTGAEADEDRRCREAIAACRETVRR